MNNITMGICKKPSLIKAEDVVGGNAEYFWLLDGATPPYGQNNHELTLKYVHELNSALAFNAVRVNDSKELLYEALCDVKERMFAIGLRENDYIPYSTVVLVKMTQKKLEYNILSDSYLDININGIETTITDDRLKNIATEERRIVREMRKNGIDELSKEYLDARKKLIETEQIYQNRKDGYWVACLNPDAANESVEGSIEINPKDRFNILALSDEMARLVTHLAVYDNLSDIGNAIQIHGEKYVFEKLRRMENDPNNFIKPISSKHDDASYFLISNQ